MHEGSFRPKLEKDMAKFLSHLIFTGLIRKKWKWSRIFRQELSINDYQVYAEDGGRW